MEASSIFTGRFTGAQGTICDATVTVNAQSDPRTITITYDGTNCTGNRTRTGTVVISMAANTQWKNAGSQHHRDLSKFEGYPHPRQQKHYPQRFSHYTNVSGGLLINPGNTGPDHPCHYERRAHDHLG